MNDELILKKRSEALQSLIKADDLQELASLSEIITTEARFFEILQISGPKFVFFSPTGYKI